MIIYDFLVPWNVDSEIRSRHNYRSSTLEMSAAQLFERIIEKDAPSRSNQRNYGAIPPPESSAGSTSQSPRGSISAPLIKPAVVELRRFSSSGAAPVEPTPVGDDMLRGREKRSGTIDEFNGEEVLPEVKMSNITKALRTGRQRKKTAARTKGGEFQAQRRKRRVYFCCISNEIDVEKLVDEFQVPHFGMTGQLYDEVLHLTISKSDTDNAAVANNADGGAVVQNGKDEVASKAENSVVENPLLNTTNPSPNSSGFFAVRQPALLSRPTPPSFEVNYRENTLYNDGDIENHMAIPLRNRLELAGQDLSHLTSYEEEGYPSANEGEYSPMGERGALTAGPASAPATITDATAALNNRTLMLSETEHCKEVFVFGFGAAVFWGLAKSDVQDLLQFIAQFIVKDPLSPGECCSWA